MIIYSIFNPQQFTTTPLQLNGLMIRPIQYLRILNNSPYQLSVNLDGILSTVPEFWNQDIAVAPWAPGNLSIGSSLVITSSSHAQAYQVTVQGMVAGEGGGSLNGPVNQQSVNITATGKPLFTATYENRATAGLIQNLEVYNPPTSGANYVFDSATVFTNDTTLPTCNLLYWNADANLVNPVKAVNSNGWNLSTNQGAALSQAHCTADDDAKLFYYPDRAADADEVPANITKEILAFPRTITINPGVGLINELSSGTTGHIIRLKLRWTEDQFLVIPTPAQGVFKVPNLTGIYSPLDYGTISGTANDDRAVQAATNAAIAAGGGIVLIHPLLHVFNNSVTGDFTNICFWGMGWGSVVKIANGINKYAFVNSAGTNGSAGGMFYNFKIDCNGANQTGASGGIDANGIYRFLFDHMWFEAPYESGMHLHLGPGGGFGFQNNIRSCQFMDGYLSASSGMGVWSENEDENRYSDCFFQSMGGSGAPVGQTQGAILTANGLDSFMGCTFVGNNHTGQGIKCTASSTAGIRVDGCIFDGVGGGNIVLSGGGGGTSIVNSRFLNIGFGGTNVDGIYVATIDVTITGNIFNPTGQTGNSCKAMVELDGNSGQGSAYVVGNVFQANALGSTQILIDGAPTNNTTTPNILH